MLPHLLQLAAATGSRTICSQLAANLLLICSCNWIGSYHAICTCEQVPTFRTNSVWGCPLPERARIAAIGSRSIRSESVATTAFAFANTVVATNWRPIALQMQISYQCISCCKSGTTPLDVVHI